MLSVRSSVGGHVVWAEMAAPAAALVPPALRPRVCETQSEVERSGRAFGDEAGPLHIAAHGAEIAMAGMAHDVLVAHAFAIGLGDEAAAQGMRAQRFEAGDRHAG
jgi:hypothetical protein